MKNFSINFKFVNGDTKTISNFTAQNRESLERSIRESADGWFGKTGDLVKLSNVITCQISDLDKEGYLKM